MNPRLAALLAVPLAGACFNPTYNNPTCGPGGACPDGFTCVGTVCERDGGDDIDAGPAPDADLSGCHVENDDVANDSAPEPTDKTGPSDLPVVCGQIRAAGDTDAYSIDTNQEFFALRVDLPGATAAGLVVTLQVTAGDQATQNWVVSSMVNDRLLVSLDGAPVGPVTVALQMQGAAPAPIDYEIRMIESSTSARCPIGANLYNEQLDTVANGHTGNDVIYFEQGMPTLTTLASDQPEGAAIPPLGAGSSTQFAGLGANVANYTASNDQYMDRDVYRIVTDNNAGDLDINLVWPGQFADLDWYLFRESDLGIQAGGISYSNTTLERATIAIAPATTYYLLISGYMGQTGDETYQAAVCVSNPLP